MSEAKDVGLIGAQLKQDGQNRVGGPGVIAAMLPKESTGRT